MHIAVLRNSARKTPEVDLDANLPARGGVPPSRACIRLDELVWCLRLSCVPAIQMGPIYLFAGCLSEALLRGVRKLGPDYAFSFEPLQVDSREVAMLPSSDPDLGALSQLGAESVLRNGTGNGDNQGWAGSRRSKRMYASKLHCEALDGVLTSLIILAYNPSVWGGEYFLDNTPERNSVRWTSGSESSTESRAKFASNEMKHDQVIPFMAGCQAHVFVQLSATRSPRRGQPAQAHMGRSRESSGHHPNPGARTRGWSSASGCSGEDSIFGGDEREVGRKLHPRPRAGYMHATRLPGTWECVRRDVRDALDCLGGVKVLLPLFAHYDHGVKRNGGGNDGGKGSGFSYETDPQLNETVLALLTGTLRDRCVLFSCSLSWLFCRCF